jgi:hypothetical protein
MSNLHKSLIAIPTFLFILACQAISSPIQQVQDTAGTAAALATQGGLIITQVSGFATYVVPIETILPDPSALPNIPSDIFDPQSTPLPEWNGIPVMPQASAGDESDGIYVYKIAVTSQEIQDFYNAKLSDLGWESSFSLPMVGTTIMMYSKENQVLSITIMPTDGSDLIVMITLE